MKLMIWWLISMVTCASLPSTITTDEQIALKRSGSGDPQARRKARRVRLLRRE